MLKHFSRAKSSSKGLLDSYGEYDTNNLNADVDEVLKFSESTVIVSPKAKPLSLLGIGRKETKSNVCQNKSCLSGASGHVKTCFTCGLTFCSSCTYKSVLNDSKAIDPLNSTPRYLCAPCFANYNRKQEIGVITDRLETIKYVRGFKAFRTDSNCMTTTIATASCSNVGNVYKTVYFDVETELKRMCCGFDNTNNSWLPSSINDVVSQAKLPNWQHGCYYQTNSEAKSCFNCLTSFSMLSGNRHHCRLCGRLFCSQCTYLELMIYKRAKKDLTSTWAINGKEGCPEEQPAVYQLFRICVGCQLLAENLILLKKEHKLVKQETEDMNNFLSEMSHIHTQIYKHKLYIQSNLFHFQDLMNFENTENYKQDFLSNLARHKMDLSENFTSFALQMQKLPKLDPYTNRHQKLLTSVSCAFTAFYMEHMNIFRELCRAMNELIPLELAKQLYNDDAYYTMNELYINFRQLCLEVLYLSSRYKILKDLNYRLIDLSDVVEKELQTLTMNRKSDWEEHKNTINIKVKENFSIRPILFKGRGYGVSHYPEDSMKRQFAGTINEYIRKLETRTTINEFTATKNVFKSLLS